MKHVSSKYVDGLRQEVIEPCTKSGGDRPEPLHELLTIASRMERPNKAQAVKESRNRSKAKNDAQ